MVLPTTFRFIASPSVTQDLSRTALHMAHEGGHGLLQSFIHQSTSLITAVGSIVLTGAIFLAAINTLIVIYNSAFEKKVPMLVSLSYGTAAGKHQATFGRVREQVGEITALGLEILVVADVMESLSRSTDAFTWEALGKMASVALFRAGLAYALGREVAEIEEKIVHEKHNKLALAK